MQMQLTKYIIETGLTDRINIGLLKLVDEDKALDIWEVFDEWNIVSNSRTTSRSGQCSYMKKQVEIHAVLLKQGQEDARRQTSIHEISHIVADLIYDSRKISGHGREWKSVMRAFGVPANRCSNHDAMKEHRLSKAKWIYGCEKCDTLFPKMRKKKYDPSRYIHKSCGGRLYLKTQVR